MKYTLYQVQLETRTHIFSYEIGAELGDDADDIARLDLADRVGLEEAEGAHCGHLGSIGVSEKWGVIQCRITGG